MFETIQQAQTEISKLTDDQLAELTVLTITEHLAGRINDEQAEFVSALILAEILARITIADAMLEKESGVTIN